MLGSGDGAMLALHGVEATSARRSPAANAPTTYVTMRRWTLAIALALALVAAFMLAPIDNGILGLVAWIRAAGAAGAAVYAASYVAVTVFLLPTSALSAGAGFVYGPLWGTLLVSPVSVLAATIAFLLGRTAARGWVARRVSVAPRFAAIDEAVGTNGFKIVLLLRLSPLFPFGLLNYALGLTRVRLRDYVLASFIGMLPITTLIVYLGSLVTSAGELLSGTAGEAASAKQALYWGGLAATIAVAGLVTRVARKALDRAIEPGSGEGRASSPPAQEASR